MSNPEDAAIAAMFGIGDDPPVHEDEDESAPPSRGTDPSSVAYVAPTSTEAEAVKFLADLFDGLDT